MNKKIKLSFLCLVALAACAGDKDKDKVDLPRHCPQVAIFRDLDKVEDYGRDMPDSSTLVALAAMKGIEGECKYKEEGVDITFTLKMGAEKGARLGGDQVSFPYFLSIVKPDDKIMDKEVLTANFQFPSGKTTARLEEALHVFIPLKEGEDASPYRVLAGFQLSEEQVRVLREKASGK